MYARTPLSDRFGPRGSFVALLMAAVLLGASFAAAAMTPDPWWIKGLYDGADGDEALSLVWEQAPAMEADALVLVAVTWAMLLHAQPLHSQAQSSGLASASRAPPLA